MQVGAAFEYAPDLGGYEGQLSKCLAKHPAHQFRILSGLSKQLIDAV